MVKKKVVKGKKSKCPPELVKDCQEIVNAAVDQAKAEIMPRLDIVDRRDKDQYEAAKKIIQDVNHIIISRIDSTEKIAKDVKGELDNIVHNQRVVIDRLEQSLDSLHNKLDSHIKIEDDEFVNLKESLNQTVVSVASIQATLNNVSANGNKGLSNSMADIYDKLRSLEDITAGKRARARVWNDLHLVFETSPFLRPLKNKWGVFFYLFGSMLLLNTVLHSFGIEFDLLNILNWIISKVKF